MSQILDIVGKLLFLVWFLWITFTVADLSGKVKRLREQDTRSPTLRADRPAEQKCPTCLTGKLESIMQCDYCFQVFDDTDISNRSAGG